MNLVFGGWHPRDMSNLAAIDTPVGQICIEGDTIAAADQGILILHAASDLNNLPDYTMWATPPGADRAHLYAVMHRRCLIRMLGIAPDPQTQEPD